MAGTTVSRTPPFGPAGQADGARFVEYEEYIERQITKTSRLVKVIEVSVAVFQLLVGLLVYLLFIVLLDHWIIRDGLGFTGRLLAFLGMAGGVLAFIAFRIVPLTTRRVNAVYAAYSIEQTQPTLKNSLVNFLLLRRERAALAAPVYNAIEQRAAKDLAAAPVDAAVDRSHLVRILYVLFALIVFFCLYKLISPKDPLQTFGRMAAPWANLAPPTRVTIGNIKPGTTKVFQGETVKVSAQVTGLRRDEPVTLYFSTADGQSVNQPAPMHLPDNGYSHEVELPGDAAGLQQNLEYYLRAGDAVSARYRIEAVTAPAILVDRVEYDYPAYAEVPRRVVERQGDIQAIDGTKITVAARANVPIKSAYIDFNADGGRDLPLALEGRTASASFTLGIKDGNPSATSYQIRFADEAGHENPQPIRHTIEISPDLPPEIQITVPGKDEVEVPINGSLAIGLRAADRDFKLRKLTLYFERGGKPLKNEVLLEESRGGEFQTAYVFEPASLSLVEFKPDDEITYWAEARDNRAPIANRAETIKYRIRLTDVVGKDEQQQQQAAAQAAARDAQKKPPQSGDPAVRAPSDKTPDPPRQPTPTAQPDEAAPSNRGREQAVEPAKLGNDQQQVSQAKTDPNGDPGDAMEQVLEFANPERDAAQPRADGTPERPNNPDKNQQKNPASNDNAGQENPPDDNQPSRDDDQEGNSGAGEDQQSPPDSRQESGAGESGQQSGGEESPDNPSGQSKDDAGDSNAGDSGSESGDSSSGQQSAGDKSGSGEKQSGDKQQGDGQGQESGEKGSSQSKGKSGSKAGSTKSGSQSGSKSKAGNAPSGAAQSDGAQPTDQQSGGKKSGSPSRGNQKSGGRQSGVQQSSTEQGENQDGSNQQDGEAPASAKRKPGANKNGGKPRQQSSPTPPDAPQGDQPGGSQAPNPTNPNDGNSNTGAQPDQGNPSGPKKPSKQSGQPQGAPQPDERGAADQNQDQSQPDGQDQPGAPSQDQQPQDASPSGQGQKGQKKQSGGQGDKSGEQGASKQRRQPSSQQKQQPDQNATGGDAQNQKGDSGAGQASSQNNPSPQSQGDNQARDKRPAQSPGQGNENKGEEANSPSNSNKESSSQGGDSGDRSGGGKQGGGQKANQPGTGSAGQNTAAEEGSGQSEEAGPGETSNQAGDSQAGKQPDSGSGSQSAGAGREGKSKTGQGKKSGQGASGQNQTSGGSNSNSSSPQTGGGAIGPSAAGGVPEQEGDASSGRGINPTTADEPNLEYTKKATDLVLDNLKNQIDKNQIDEELLKKLNWTPEDVKKFVARWDQMRKAAAKAGAEGEQARQELEQALNKLHLKRHGVAIQQQGTRGDNRAVRESRYTSPPPEYAEQFRAYTEGASKTGLNGSSK